MQAAAPTLMSTRFWRAGQRLWIRWQPSRVHTSQALISASQCDMPKMGLAGPAAVFGKIDAARDFVLAFAAYARKRPSRISGKAPSCASAGLVRAGDVR